MKTRVATAVAAAKLVAAHATDVCSSGGANAPLRKNGGGGGLTRLVDPKLVGRLGKTHGNSGRAAVTSIRLSLISSRDESLAVVLEPFGNDPE